MSKQEPYISFIATSRNDNHGGSLTRRMQIFVQGLIAQCKRFNLPAELILVEWNPPADRPPLAQELKWPADTGPLKVRVVTVPRELHLRYKHSEHLPLFQMIAKNVGIRRARAPFVLATNIDILFNDELIHFFAERRLESGRMYRIDRFDVAADVPESAAIDEQLDYCSHNLLRVNRRDWTLPVSAHDQRQTIFDNDIFPKDSGMTYGDGWSALKFEARGRPYRFIRSGAELCLTPPDSGISGIHLDIEPSSGVQNLAFRLSVYNSTKQQIAAGIVLGQHDLFVKLPVSKGVLLQVRLEITSGGSPDPDTGHVLDAKVRTCDWTKRKNFEFPLSPKIPYEFTFSNMVPKLKATAISKIRNMLGLDEKRFDITRFTDRLGLMSNWHAFEVKDGRYARWVDNDATFAYANNKHKKRVLEIELESGPGFFYDQFSLQVFDADGKIVAEQIVAGNEKRKARFLRNLGRRSSTEDARIPTAEKTGRASLIKAIPKVFRHLQVLRLELPLKPDALNTFTLHGEYHGSQAVKQPVYMGFRVFRCQWASSEPDEVLDASQINNDAMHFAAGLKTAILLREAADRDGVIKQQIAAVHMNACGDFTLMSKGDWHKFRGYAELEMYSMHIDSLGCHTAVCAGAKEIVLKEPMRIYHIEHGQGSGWTPEGEAKLFGRMREKGIPVMEYRELLDYAKQMYREGPIMFNGEDWGLAKENLPETVIGT